MADMKIGDKVWTYGALGKVVEVNIVGEEQQNWAVDAPNLGSTGKWIVRSKSVFFKTQKEAQDSYLISLTINS